MWPTRSPRPPATEASTTSARRSGALVLGPGDVLRRRRRARRREGRGGVRRRHAPGRGARTPSGAAPSGRWRRVRSRRRRRPTPTPRPTMSSRDARLRRRRRSTWSTPRPCRSRSPATSTSLEVNPRLSFDREAAYGRHLDIAGRREHDLPPGRPDDRLVPIRGERVVIGSPVSSTGRSTHRVRERRAGAAARDRLPRHRSPGGDPEAAVAASAPSPRASTRRCRHDRQPRTRTPTSTAPHRRPRAPRRHRTRRAGRGSQPARRRRVPARLRQRPVATDRPARGAGGVVRRRRHQRPGARRRARIRTASIGIADGRIAAVGRRATPTRPTTSTSWSVRARSSSTAG